VVQLTLAEDRWRWFVRHLLDLAVIAMPFLRSLRLVVLVGALQKAVGDAIRGRVVTYTVVGALLLVWVASLAVLDAERAPGSDIQTIGQALWWSVATITTVGYGDLTPVTATGRIVAVLLMIGGIRLVGFITATIASWIVQRVAEEDTKAATVAHVEALRAEVHALRDEIRRLGESKVAE
jgi:voltage-gated potassium channel